MEGNTLVGTSQRGKHQKKGEWEGLLEGPKEKKVGRTRRELAKGEGKGSRGRPVAWRGRIGGVLQGMILKKGGQR